MGDEEQDETIFAGGIERPATDLGQPESSFSTAEAVSPKLYVVCGATGEYSDRSEWTTWAFPTEATARAYVEFLNRYRQEIGGPPDDRWDFEEPSEYGRWLAKMRRFDPGFSEDYTGTSWFVSEVDVGEPPELPAEHDPAALSNATAPTLKNRSE